MKKYYVSFCFFKGVDWNFGSTCIEKGKLTEEVLGELEKDLSERLEVKNVIFIAIKELEG